jgi:hypothetical protein
MNALAFIAIAFFSSVWLKMLAAVWLGFYVTIGSWVVIGGLLGHIFGKWEERP